MVQVASDLAANVGRNHFDSALSYNKSLELASGNSNSNESR
jgi:hypothetical protein